MHRLMDEYGLDGEVRWLGMRMEKSLTGELYRYVADKRGVFAQPALFEAFGLTVIEAMACGVPTFATCYGGPLEVGMYYQFRATSWRAAGAKVGPISATEDLRGVFYVTQ